MKVESQAGKFILSFEAMEPGENEIVITGKMGVWDAKTHMSLPEMATILRMTLRLHMLAFLIGALFRGAFRARTQGAD